MYKDLDEVAAANAANGLHWFEESTMAFFDTVLETDLIDGQWFITTEKHPDASRTIGWGRRASVRKVLPGGAVKTEGEFGGHATVGDARLWLMRERGV